MSARLLFFLDLAAHFGCVADPDPGSGMNNPDHISESLETICLGLKYLNSLMRFGDPVSGKEKNSVPGGKKFGSATLHFRILSKKSP